MKLTLFGAIVLICVAGWGWYLYNKPHVSVKDLKTDFFMKAPDLYNAFSIEEKNAGKKYSDKIIEVTGIVQNTYKTDSTMSVQLDANNLLSGINCSMALDENKKEDLPAAGSMVTIKGKCAGFLMDVDLVDCVFINKK